MAMEFSIVFVEALNLNFRVTMEVSVYHALPFFSHKDSILILAITVSEQIY